MLIFDIGAQSTIKLKQPIMIQGTFGTFLYIYRVVVNILNSKIFVAYTKMNFLNDYL